MSLGKKARVEAMFAAFVDCLPCAPKLVGKTAQVQAMGNAPSEAASVDCLPKDIKDLPPFFVDIFVELLTHKSTLGDSSRHHLDFITHKITMEEFNSSFTNYEYIFLTVLGFAKLHLNLEEITTKNNSKEFRQNPGVQMLESVCGMTMHGERDGANALLRNAPNYLIEAFEVSKATRNGPLEFFKTAFDRTADPCLEGRTGRILEYLEKHRKGNTPVQTAPWEEVSLRPLPRTAQPRDVIAEHLRVFVNECTWRWSREKGLTYEQAKQVRLSDTNAADFSRLYNASTFADAMRARGIVANSSAMRWEVTTDQSSGWSAYDDNISLQIDGAAQKGLGKVEVQLGPKGWRYEIDIGRLVQRNAKTGKERPVRRSNVPVPVPQGRLAEQDLMKAIQYFVDMETLPRAS